MIRAWFRRWFTPHPAKNVSLVARVFDSRPNTGADAYVSVTSLPATAGPDSYSIPVITEAERIAAGDAARAARAEEIAAQVRVNQFEDPPEVCAARAADPVWRAEQVAKREAASEAFVRYRNEESGLPLVVKGRY